MEGGWNGRQLEWRAAGMEGYQNGRRPEWKLARMKGGKNSQEFDLIFLFAYCDF